MLIWEQVLILKRRVLASIQQQPNYLQSVYMMQNLQLFIDCHILEH